MHKAHLPPVISLPESARCLRRVDERHVLHPQVGEQSFEHSASLATSDFPSVFFCNMPSTSIQCLPSSTSTSRWCVTGCSIIPSAEAAFDAIDMMKAHETRRIARVRQILFSELFFSSPAVRSGGAVVDASGSGFACQLPRRGSFGSCSSSALPAPALAQASLLEADRAGFRQH